MAMVRVTFRECLQDSQDFGSTDDHMVSRVSVSISVDGGEEGEYIADLKQTVGSQFEDGPIEVSRPRFNDKEHRGPWDQAAFAEAAIAYYRGLIGASGAGIRFGSAARNIHMRGNSFMSTHVVTFEAQAPGGRAW